MVKKASAMALPAPTKSGSFSSPPDYFGDALADAERLLLHASETGVDVPAEVRDHVLEARAAANSGWDESTASNLLTALAKLAALLKPVTARSLEASSSQTRHVVRNYWIIAILLAIVIGPFSVLSFVTSGISSTIRSDIAAANDLSVKLRAKLGEPNDATKNPDDPGGEIITDLQQYAAYVRSIDRKALQLNILLFHSETDPNAPIRGHTKKVHDQFELPQGSFNFSTETEKINGVYQDVRYFAQNLLDDVSLYYGAITICVLPVLYALLGTCAYLLRTYARQMATRTFTPYHSANSARFLVAGIGGAVVGLFNNFAVGQGASIPPLAIAFLVGYAVDVFFSLLESIVQSFTKRASSQAASGGEN
jgi:hypothetical protein